jgi:hypothetical protein
MSDTHAAQSLNRSLKLEDINFNPTLRDSEVSQGWSPLFLLGSIQSNIVFSPTSGDISN